MPSTFPEYIDYYEDNTYYQNPVIGDTQEQTRQNICQILEFFTLMAMPTHIEKADFSLDEESTWGFVRILQCMTGALKFEEKHRPDKGEPLVNQSEESESDRK